MEKQDHLAYKLSLVLHAADKGADQAKQTDQYGFSHADGQAKHSKDYAYSCTKERA